jgi:ABC-2 type transport system ATP-binding protein
MKLMATALPVQAGSISYGDLVLGKSPVRDVRRLLGYLPQRFSIMGTSTVIRNVSYAAWAHGMKGKELSDAVEYVLEVFDLSDRAKSRAVSLSGGMRQRLGLACALVHTPRIAILDEPTVGLDPVQRSELRRCISRIGQRSSVLISTHLVEDLVGVAEQVLVMNEGILCFAGSVVELAQAGVSRERAEGLSSGLEAGYTAVLGASR